MFSVKDLHLAITMRPRGAGLIVVPLLEARRGLLVDMEENREKPLKGIVVAKSAGGTAPETGRPLEILSAVGDLVAFGKYAGLVYHFEVPVPDGDPRIVKAYIMRDSEVLASQEEGTYDLTIHDGDPNKMHLAGLTCELCETVQGEAGLERLRAIAGGLDPDAPAPSEDELIAKERDRAPSLIIPGA